MEIKEVSRRKQLKEFVQFPKKLYKDCPYYVPAMDHAEIRSLTKHPALKFCSLKMWLAYQDGVVVGRIAGIINHKCNTEKNQKRVRFGWFDVVEDQEVAFALLNMVETWGASMGMNTICGPSRFSNMEKQSMLIEGFDHRPAIVSDYNFPFYPKMVENFGFEKEVDYVQYKVKVDQVPERIQVLSEKISERYKVRIRSFKNKKELIASGFEFFQTLNESYAKIFNFIPLTREEMAWAINEMLQVADIQHASVLEDEQGRMVGFAFCLPSLSDAFQKAKGRLFPFGWFHILRALKHNKNVDMLLTGVLPAYQHTGVHVLYHKKLNEIFFEKGYEYAFTSQQLEDNVAARIWRERYDAELLFRRRCYKKEIETKKNIFNTK